MPKTAWKGKKLDREGERESLASLWIRHCQFSSSKDTNGFWSCLISPLIYSRKLLQRLERNVGFVPLSYMPRVQPEVKGLVSSYFVAFDTRVDLIVLSSQFSISFGNVSFFRKGEITIQSFSKVGHTLYFSLSGTINLEQLLITTGIRFFMNPSLGLEILDSLWKMSPWFV